MGRQKGGGGGRSGARLVGVPSWVRRGAPGSRKLAKCEGWGNCGLDACDEAGGPGEHPYEGAGGVTHGGLGRFGYFYATGATPVRYRSNTGEAWVGLQGENGG
jgi:hypothetical protein